MHEEIVGVGLELKHPSARSHVVHHVLGLTIEQHVHLSRSRFGGFAEIEWVDVREGTNIVTFMRFSVSFAA